MVGAQKDPAADLTGCSPGTIIGSLIEKAIWFYTHPPPGCPSMGIASLTVLSGIVFFSAGPVKPLRINEPGRAPSGLLRVGAKEFIAFLGLL